MAGEEAVAQGKIEMTIEERLETLENNQTYMREDIGALKRSRSEMGDTLWKICCFFKISGWVLGIAAVLGIILLHC